VPPLPPPAVVRAGQSGEGRGGSRTYVETVHSVETVDVPVDVARQRMLASGRRRGGIYGFELVRAGGNATLTDDVEGVLGRPPRTFLS
jgi:hypothetical protein